MVVLLDFATGALVRAAIGPWSGKETGEMALPRELLERFQPGDVFVADRAYCSYWLIATLQARGVDVVIRLHQSRHYDFETGWRLGNDDHVVEWPRPVRPVWLDKATYRATPKALTIREVRFSVEQAGYRTRQIIVATTLSDAKTYARVDLSELYHHRRRVEVAFFESKQLLGLHDPHVRTQKSVERTHPMAWFVQTMTILWYATAGGSAQKSNATARGTRTRPRPRSRTCSGCCGSSTGSNAFRRKRAMARISQISTTP
jgi:hypothetical protein